MDLAGGGPGRGAASRLLRSLPDGFRLIPLAAADATAAAIRYVQIPRLLEMRVAPEIVVLTVGAADLAAALGDDGYARAALDALEEHVDALLGHLRRICPDGARVLLGGIDPQETEPWPLPSAWVARYNESLRERARRAGAGWEGDPGELEERWRQALAEAGGTR